MSKVSNKKLSQYQSEQEPNVSYLHSKSQPPSRSRESDSHQQNAHLFLNQAPQHGYVFQYNPSIHSTDPGPDRKAERVGDQNS